MIEYVECRDSIVLDLKSAMTIKPPSPTDNSVNCSCSLGWIYNRIRQWKLRRNSGCESKEANSISSNSVSS